MSNNQQPPTNNDIQYASTTPSLASLLSLPQVQDKKKPVIGAGGLAVGGIKATPGLVGKPLTLGLKKTPASLNKPVAPVSIVSVASVSEIKTPSTPVADNAVKPTVSLVTTSTAVLSAPVHAKVKKFKSKAGKDEQEYKKIAAKSRSEPATSSTVDQLDPAHWRLFVGNLGPEVSDTLLLSTFQNPYPSTSKALVIRDWKSQKSKGYGFVAFAEGKEFLRALKEMQGKWIGNRQAIIKKSEHQPTTLNK